MHFYIKFLQRKLKRNTILVVFFFVFLSFSLGFSNKVFAATNAYWHLDEQSGSGAYLLDSSGNNLNATPTGTTSVVGKVGRARQLTGSSTYISFPTNTLPSGNSIFTIDTWVKFDSFTTADIIVAYGNDVLAGKSPVISRNSSTGKFSFEFGSGVGMINGTTTVQTGVWYYVAATYDKSNIRIYVNGALEGTLAFTTVNIDPINNKGNYVGGIGAMFSIWGSDGIKYGNLNAIVDEVRISNTAFSAATILSNYQSVIYTPTPSPTPIPAPILSSINVENLPISGGNVVLTGNNFYGTPTVTFGGTSGTNINRINATTINVTAPAHSVGLVNIVVTNPDSQSATLFSKLSYINYPTISSLNPIIGSLNTGTNVTITGTNFMLTTNATSFTSDANTLGLWHLDEASGSTVYDSSSYGRNGTATGTTVISGKTGNARSFSGSDYITIGNLGNFPTQGTVEFWVNAPALVSYPNAFTTNFNGNNAGIRFELNSVGNFSVAVGNDAATFDGCDYFPNSNFQINTWYHIAYVWNTSTNQEIAYLNGVPVCSNSHTLWPTTMPNVSIGSGFSSSRYWKGGVDEVRISNIARSNSDILLDAGKTYKPTVTFGGTSATNVFAVSSTSITLVAPTHSQGVVDVVVTNPDGSSVTSTGSFTYDGTAPSTPNSMTTPNTINNYINNSFTADIPSGSTDTGGSALSAYSLWKCDDALLTLNCAVIASGVNGTTVNVSGSYLPTNGNTMYYYWTSVDGVGNSSNGSDAVGLTMDSAAPTTAVTITNNTYDSATYIIADTINGTSNDSGSGLSSVEVSIQRSSDSKYWTGSLWSDTESWVAVTTGTSTWSYSFNDSNLDAHVDYTVRARATDVIGNTTSSGFGADTFTYTGDAIIPNTPTPTSTPGGNTVQNVPSGIVPVLNTDWNTNVGTTGQLGVQTVGVEDTTNTNVKIAELNVDFDSVPNWTGVTGGTNENTAFFHSTQPISTITNGAATSYSLYIKKGNGVKVWICPGAASLNEVTLHCSGGYSLTEGQTANSATATLVTIDSVLYWKVSGLTGTGGMSIVTGAQDTLTRLETSQASNHSIQFTTNTGVLLPTDLMFLTFPSGFDFNGLDYTDIDLLSMGSQLTLDLIPGTDTWGVFVTSANNTITFVPPTDGTGYIPAGAIVNINIGTNATSGVNQILNPTNVGSYPIELLINNADGQEAGTMDIPIIESDTVDITGYVTAYIHFDIDTNTDNTECNSSGAGACLTHSTGSVSSNYTVDLGELTSAIVNKSLTSSKHSDGANGLINSIYFDLTTNAPSGAVVTVKSLNGGLQGPGTNTIPSIGITTGADGITRYDGEDIPANSGVYGYNLPVASTALHGTVLPNSLCNSLVKFCGAPSLTPKTVFTTNNLPIDTARVRMDLAAAANYTNNPGVYTDTLTFVATATF